MAKAEGKLNLDVPGQVTQSLVGCDYLDLVMQLEDGTKIRVSMPVDAMLGLGFMMNKVAGDYKNR